MPIGKNSIVRAAKAAASAETKVALPVSEGAPVAEEVVTAPTSVAAEAAPKKRGRKPKNPDGAKAAESTAKDAAPKKKPGRKPAAGKASAKKTTASGKKSPAKKPVVAASAVIANISPEVVEKVAKVDKNHVSIGDKMPAYLL